MSTTAQLLANRENALSSTGPKTDEGKTRCARNAVRYGLFTMNDFVIPEEAAEHALFCADFWNELKPASPVEQTFAMEIIRAAWRLRRCGLVEASLAETPEQNEAAARAQNAVDRARSQANNIFRRAHNDLRCLQAERRRQAPVTLAPAAPQNGFGFSDLKKPALPGENSAAKQTQSIPRNAPCPCASGEKYKRCCGRNAPPVLHLAA